MISHAPELASKKRTRYAQQELSPETINILLSSLPLTTFFEETAALINDPVKISNYLVGEVLAYLNTQNQEIDQSKLTPKNLAEMIDLLNKGTISSKHAKTILELILVDDQKPPHQLVEELGLKLISDPQTIDQLLNPIIEQNQSLIAQFNERPERVLKALMGQLMKETKGNVNPDLATELILKRIKK